MLLTLADLEREFGRVEVRVHDFRPVTKTGGIMALAEVRRRFDTGTGPDGMPWAPLAFPRPEGGSIPLRNHGILAASYTYESGGDYFRVGTNHEAARLQHYGGTVVPIAAKFLTLPITREAVYAGRARNMPGLHAEANDRGGVLADNQHVAHWLLVKSVTIPARPQVGLSDELFRRWCGILVTYLRTGSV